MIPRSRGVRSLLTSAGLCAGLGGCLVGPDYHPPEASTPPAYKEAAGWAPARPSDAAQRADWWTAFGDPVLNSLESKVEVSNQTLAADEAAYRQARALVAEDRAALFPTVSLGFSASAQKASGSSRTVGVYEPSIGASWAPDLWGAVRRNIESARATAEASAATLANARLSLQTELAVDYVELRQLDEETRLLQSTLEAYRKTETIASNKYRAGVSAKADVLSAQSQRASTEANLTDLEQQRAKLEHAIAILVGEPPSALSLPPSPWGPTLPQIPAQAPSALLQRRPDVAAAERQMAAENALIGVQVAAYYPNITLSGSFGSSASEIGQVFNATNELWSVGGSLSETVFDAGARRARVRIARAAYDQAVANYRQTVLTALSQVEDNLAAQRVLAREEVNLSEASRAADQAEAITRNQYAAGTVDFTTVVTAQATALNARKALLAVQANRLTVAVDLIEALGGGWSPGDLKALAG